MTTTQSKVEFRIVNTAARSIFSERHLTMERGYDRIWEWDDVPEGTPVYLTEAELYLIGFTFADMSRAKGLIAKVDAALKALKDK